MPDGLEVGGWRLEVGGWRLEVDVLTAHSTTLCFPINV
jgi:hypothetical protein